MSEGLPIPRLGDIVFYYDDNRQPHAAIIAFVHDKVAKGSDRPICNLAIFQATGMMSPQQQVEPAYHDGDKWRMINKYSWPEEIDEEEWNHLPKPKHRERCVGKGEYLPTT